MKKAKFKCPYCHGKGIVDPLEGYDWQGLFRYWAVIGLTLSKHVRLEKPKKPDAKETR